MAWRLREWELATLKSYNEEKPTWYIFENYQLHYDVLMAYIIIKVCHTRIAFIPQTVVFLIKPSFERETVHTHACFLAAKNSIRERPCACVNRQNYFWCPNGKSQRSRNNRSQLMTVTASGRQNDGGNSMCFVSGNLLVKFYHIKLIISS